VHQGTPLYVPKEFGGWETLEMANRYAHLAPERLRVYCGQQGWAGSKASLRPRIRDCNGVTNDAYTFRRRVETSVISMLQNIH